PSPTARRPPRPRPLPRVRRPPRLRPPLRVRLPTRLPTRPLPLRPKRSDPVRSCTQFLKGGGRVPFLFFYFSKKFFRFNVCYTKLGLGKESSRRYNKTKTAGARQENRHAGRRCPGRGQALSLGGNCLRIF